MLGNFGKIHDDLFIKFLLGLDSVLDKKRFDDELYKTKYSKEDEEIKALYRRHNLPEPRIFLTNKLLDSFGKDMPNAGTTPFGHSVFLSEGLLKINAEVGADFKQKYGKSFLEHVFSHEIGHLKNSVPLHLLGDFLKVTGCLILMKFRPFKNTVKSSNNLVNLTCELVASALILNYVNIPVNLMRQQREFEADNVAASLTSPSGFADTLKTLQERVDVIGTEYPPSRTLYKSLKKNIDHALKPVEHHPDIKERIKRLEQLAQDSKLSLSSSAM